NPAGASRVDSPIMWVGSRLHWNRRTLLLFAVVVVLPTLIFSVLIIRAVRSEQLQSALQKTERQRQIVRLVEADLNSWLFSTEPDSAIAEALFRFALEGDRINFPDVGLSLPVAGAPPPRPSAPPPPGGPLDAQVVIDFYYPRIVIFLRD